MFPNFISFVIVLKVILQKNKAEHHEADIIIDVTVTSRGLLNLFIVNDVIKVNATERISYYYATKYFFSL